MLTSEERGRIARALWEWAESVPDEPLLGFVGYHGLMTPREIAAQVEENTPDGRAVLEMLEHGVRREGIEAVVSRLHRQIAR